MCSNLSQKTQRELLGNISSLKSPAGRNEVVDIFGRMVNNYVTLGHRLRPAGVPKELALSYHMSVER